jgi:hypothetical protein
MHIYREIINILESYFSACLVAIYDNQRVWSAKEAFYETSLKEGNSKNGKKETHHT